MQREIERARQWRIVTRFVFMLVLCALAISVLRT